jgi:hypothetical protein
MYLRRFFIKQNAIGGLGLLSIQSVGAIETDIFTSNDKLAILGNPHTQGTLALTGKPERYGRHRHGN